VGEVAFLPNKLSRIELTSDRMVEVVETDLIVGISMSAGKTTLAKVIVRLLRGEDLTVARAKLPGR
jgi:molybdopterin-guanine dinucleotide biosynthesis protein